MLAVHGGERLNRAVERQDECLDRSFLTRQKLYGLGCGVSI